MTRARGEQCVTSLPQPTQADVNEKLLQGPELSAAPITIAWGHALSCDLLPAPPLEPLTDSRE